MILYWGLQHFRLQYYHPPFLSDSTHSSGFIRRNADFEWFHCFVSFWPIFNRLSFLTNCRVCWGCSLLFMILQHFRYYNPPFLSDFTHSMWFYMMECWFLRDFHCFGSFSPVFGIFWQGVGSIEVVYGLTTFQMTIIHHFWVIPLIQCGFIWRDADF